MKNRIVVKLFLLTSFLCILILVGVFAGQSIFFEKYYIKNKEEKLIEATEDFKKSYQNKNVSLNELEQTFSNENNALIKVIDKDGYMEGTNNVNIEIENSYISLDGEYNFNNETESIPVTYLDNFFDSNEQLTSLNDYKNHQIEVHGVQVGEDYYPYEVIISKEESSPDLNTIMSSDLIDNLFYWKNDLFLEKAKDHKYDDEYTFKNMYGILKSVNIPEEYNVLYATTISNQTFVDQLKRFQSELIFNNQNSLVLPTSREFEQDGINYKLLIDLDVNEDGELFYFVTMTSLQPIDEASGLLQDYYVYVLVIVLILILLASFYFSKKITSPLLIINSTAKQMANLNFKEKIPVKTNDEIGQLSESINSLSEKLKTHIHQLNEDIEKEKQLEKTRKDFIAGVSHELKTPISIMKSCISIIEDGIAKEKKDYYFQAMNKEVNRMDRLIVDMLELAKFESGTYKLDTEPFLIQDSIHSVYNQLVIQAQKKNLQIELQLNNSMVLANQFRIEQVLTNFLSNAIRHTPHSGKIVISMFEEESRVKINIENEGEHIHPNQMNKIWDSFYQEEKTHRSKDGTGLGLAISKNILKLHQSQYGVCNKKEGVCFYFYLTKANF